MSWNDTIPFQSDAVLLISASDEMYPNRRSTRGFQSDAVLLISATATVSNRTASRAWFQSDAVLLISATKGDRWQVRWRDEVSIRCGFVDLCDVVLTFCPSCAAGFNPMRFC